MNANCAFHAIFCLLYTQQSYFGIKYKFATFYRPLRALQHSGQLSVLLPNSAKLPPGLCCFQSIFVFRFFF